jgi:hypothetical protein
MRATSAIVRFAGISGRPPWQMGIDRSQHFAALIAIAGDAKVIMDAAARIEPLAIKAWGLSLTSAGPCSTMIRY